MSRFSASHASRLLATTGIASAILLGTLAAPAATLAKGGGTVVRATGTCTIASTAKLKAKHDNGRIEVEFEVDQNRNNRLWTVSISDNGTRVFTGTRRTVAPSGSFSVERRIANRAGTDRIVARAVNARSGEVCRAVLGL
jgi:hypothetical protein